MTDDDVLMELRRWGYVKVVAREVRQEARENPRAHIIERTRRFAPLTLKRAAKNLVRRDGESRRRIMAKAAGVKGMPITPLWSSDPIKCAQTRKGQWARPTGDEPKLDMPAELQWIDAALSALGAKSAILALIVRVEFTHDGTQKERAMEARKRYGGTLTFWQYRKELERAVSWLIGWRAAKAA